MEALRQYIISVTSAAVICGIVTGFFPGGTMKNMVRLICGFFLAFVVLRPIAGFDFDAALDLGLSFADDGEALAAIGEETARDAYRDIIKQQTEAYILDKAAEHHADLTVEVTVSDDDVPVPVAVTLTGQVSPYARQQLQAMLQRDLAIAKEDQQWIS